MKTNFRRIVNLFAVVAMAGAVALTSCNDYDVTPNPEDVEQNIAEAYYISGVVSSSSGDLSGVKVSVDGGYVTTDSDGVYLIELALPATTSVTFSKDGYVSVTATAIFADDAATGAIVSLSQELASTVTAQTAEAGEASELSFDNDLSSDIVVSIPADALTEDTDISVTYFTPSATASAAETLAILSSDSGTSSISSSLLAVDLQPSGTTFDSDITISIPGDYIDGAYHAKLVNGEWVNQGTATYNQTSGAYEITVDGFSQHSIALDTDVSVSSGSTTSVELYEYTLDNRGNTKSTSKALSYDKNIGWELSDSSSSTLSTYVAGLFGTSAGLSTTTMDLDLVAAGDQMVSVTVTQLKTTTSFTVGSTTTTSTSYGDVSVELETTWGTMRPDHN